MAYSVRAPKITIAVIDQHRLRHKGEAGRIWSGEVKGLCARIAPSGLTTFTVKTRVQGRQRWITIGHHGTWTPSQARDRAREILVEIQSGRFVDRPKGLSDAMNCEQLARLYLKAAPTWVTVSRPTPKRQQTLVNERSCLENHFIPELGRVLVSDLTTEKLRQLQDRIATKSIRSSRKTKARGVSIVRGGTATAGATLRYISTMLTWAVTNGHILHNPARGFQKYTSRVRQRHLTETEITILFNTLSVLESEGRIPAPYGDIIRLLLLTGGRRTEINALKWSEIDLAERLLRLPEQRSKTGAVLGAKTIELGEAAIDVLNRQHRSGPFVFPARKRGSKSGYTVGWIKPFKMLIEKAGIEDLCPHDLRRSYGATALNNGVPIEAISKQFGHASVAMTLRVYAPLSRVVRQRGNDQATGVISKLMSGKAGPSNNTSRLSTHQHALSVTPPQRRILVVRRRRPVS